MEDISFNEEPRYAVPNAQKQQSFLIRLVFATGAAKTEKGAQQVLLAIVIVATLFVAGMAAFGSSGENHEYVPPLLPPSNAYR